MSGKSGAGKRKVVRKMGELAGKGENIQHRTANAQHPMADGRGCCHNESTQRMPTGRRRAGSGGFELARARGGHEPGDQANEGKVPSRVGKYGNEVHEKGIRNLTSRGTYLKVKIENQILCHQNGQTGQNKMTAGLENKIPCHSSEFQPAFGEGNCQDE